MPWWGARSGNLDGRRLTRARDRDGGQAETGERVARRPQSIGFDYWENGVKIVVGRDPPRVCEEECRLLVRDGDQIARSERRRVIVIVHERPHRDNLEVGG